MIGNAAAHPLRHATTGAVLRVDSGEAEWTLAVIEGLFEHYFVGPARAAARKNALNLKLSQAGRKPLT